MLYFLDLPVQDHKAIQLGAGTVLQEKGRMINDPKGDSETIKAITLVSAGQIASNQSHGSETPIQQSPGRMTPAWQSCGMGRVPAESHGMGGAHEDYNGTQVYMPDAH